MTSRQNKFVHEYMLDLNGTRAAIAAGYSLKTAHSIANENLKKPEIQMAIKHQQQASAQDTKITREKIINELAKYAFRSSSSEFDDITPRDAIVALTRISEMFGFDVKDEGPHEYEIALKEAMKALDQKRGNRFA